MVRGTVPLEPSSLSPQTPCTGGASFPCDRPFFRRLTQETCGFVWRVQTATRLASVEQHGRRREEDGMEHQNVRLPGR